MTEEHKERGWTTRVGEACVLALFVAVLASVPAALRTARAGGTFPDGLLTGAAVLLPPLVVLLVLARAAGRGFRALVGQASPRLAALGIALWLALTVPTLALLGTLLKATTHHRGLGGGTFAMLSVAVVVAAAVAAHRLILLGQRVVSRGMQPWIPAVAGALIAVVPTLLALSPLVRGGDAPATPAVRATILDGAIALVATALCASFDVSHKLGRLARSLGVPVAAIVALAGLLRVESSPPLARALRAGGGLSATLLGVLEAWTDRDADGSGAHFGGGDCDEGDPRRHPGATEVAGDGLDSDCDGVDPAPPVAVTAVTASPAAPRAPSRLDIVLVTLDTVRADRSSSYGYGKATTPNLDELAARGTLFERAYAVASDAQRAMSPFVSGRRLARTPHDRREWPTVLPEVDTLAERLKRAGYATRAVTSFTWLSAERGFAQGFDRFDTAFSEVHPERGVTGPIAVGMAQAIVEAHRDSGAPLFLWVHLFDAHERYIEHDGLDFGRGRSGAYDGEVAFVDRQLGALVAAVAASPRGARTAFVVHGTHGEALGEHDLTGHGVELWEELLRVPLVVSVPGQGARRITQPAVSTLDVAPTILALAGAEAAGVAGENLLPAVQGESFQRPPVWARTTRRATVVDGTLKLVVTERRRGSPRLALFDLAEDPHETMDLAGSRADDAERLRELLRRLEAVESDGGGGDGGGDGAEPPAHARVD